MFLKIFCLLVLSSVEKEVLTLPAIFVYFSFTLSLFCLMYFNTLFGAYESRIVIYS